MQSTPTLSDDVPNQQPQASKTRPSRRKGRRESYTRFTPAEQAMLLEGVARYGAGNWKKILSSFQFHHKRTAVDLKDKYRNILRAQERARAAGLKASGPSELPAHGNEQALYAHRTTHEPRPQSSQTGHRHSHQSAFLRPIAGPPPPTEPPVVPLRVPGHLGGRGLAKSLPYHSMSLAPIPHTKGISSSTERGSGHMQRTAASEKTRAPSSMHVAALLTAPDVSY